MSIITIDPYYSVSFYNESLQAMRNNDVSFRQMLYIKGNTQMFCLDVPNDPMMVNYDSILRDQYRYLVNVVTPITTSDSVILTRRNNDVNSAIRDDFYLNDALRSIDDYAAFIHIPSHEESLRLSNDVDLWYFGKYKHYRVHLITNPYYQMFIHPDNVLLTKDDNESVVQFEQRFNYKVLRTMFLNKRSQTERYTHGKFVKVRSKYDFNG